MTRTLRLPPIEAAAAERDDSPRSSTSLNEVTANGFYAPPAGPRCSLSLSQALAEMPSPELTFADPLPGGDAHARGGQADDARDVADAGASPCKQDGAVEAQRLRTCSICFDADVPVDEGIECLGRPPDVHFACRGCFEGYVQSRAEEELRLVRARAGRIHCPVPGCACQPWSDVAVAKAVSEDVFDRHLESARLVREEALNRELEEKFERRLEDELRRRQEMDEESRWLEDAKRHVVDKILTLACPRCGQAFLDFEGCFALTCSRCQCGFCAYCLADCGADAHEHVRSCVHNRRRDYFGTEAEFQGAQRRRRQSLLNDYAAALGEQRRAMLLRALEPELRELGLEALGARGGRGIAGEAQERGPDAPGPRPPGRRGRGRPGDGAAGPGVRGGGDGGGRERPPVQPGPRPVALMPCQREARRAARQPPAADANRHHVPYPLPLGAVGAVAYQAGGHRVGGGAAANQAQLREARLAFWDGFQEAAPGLPAFGRAAPPPDAELRQLCQIFPQLDEAVARIALEEAGGVQAAAAFLAANALE